jgi:hypothetical protein
VLSIGTAALVACTSLAGLSERPAETSIITPEVGFRCSSIGENACGGAAQSQTLVCAANGIWIAGQTCTGDELCDNRPGAGHGKCVPRDPSCARAAPGNVVCRGTERVKCGPDLVSSEGLGACPKVCVAGECRECLAEPCAGTCTPSTVRCFGDTLKTCGSNGEWDAGTKCEIGGSVCAGATCQVGKRAFISRAVFPASFGNAQSADLECSRIAQTAGFGSNWAAWLSDDDSSPSTRFTKPTTPYFRLDGTIIAPSYASLTSGSIAGGIAFDEMGVLFAANDGALFWTSTLENGTVFAGRHCEGWTSTAVSSFARFNNPHAAGSYWSQGYDAQCSGMHSLLCFEQ